MGESDIAASSALSDLMSLEIQEAYETSWIAIGQRIVPLSDAVVSVLDRGLMYGDGLYTTMRVSSSQPLFIERHLARLQRDMNRLLFGTSLEDFDLKNVVSGIIAANRIYDGYVRIQITRGSRMSFPSLEATSPVCICLAGRLPSPVQKSLSVITVPDPRDIYRDAKTTNRISALFALREATLRGAGEAIFIDEYGPVEATCHNIFAQVNNKIVTPPINGRGLPGIIRQVLLDAQVVTEANFLFSDVDSLFLTNCLLVNVLPIHSVDGRCFDVDWETCDIISKIIQRCAYDPA